LPVCRFAHAPLRFVCGSFATCTTTVHHAYDTGTHARGLRHHAYAAVLRLVPTAGSADAWFGLVAAVCVCWLRARLRARCARLLPFYLPRFRLHVGWILRVLRFAAPPHLPRVLVCCAPGSRSRALPACTHGYTLPRVYCGSGCGFTCLHGYFAHAYVTRLTYTLPAFTTHGLVTRRAHTPRFCAFCTGLYLLRCYRTFYAFTRTRFFFSLPLRFYGFACARLRVYAHTTVCVCCHVARLRLVPAGCSPTFTGSVFCTTLRLLHTRGYVAAVTTRLLCRSVYTPPFTHVHTLHFVHTVGSALRFPLVTFTCHTTVCYVLRCTQFAARSRTHAFCGYVLPLRTLVTHVRVTCHTATRYGYTVYAPYTAFCHTHLRYYVLVGCFTFWLLPPRAVGFTTPHTFYRIPTLYRRLPRTHRTPVLYDFHRGCYAFTRLVTVGSLVGCARSTFGSVAPRTLRLVGYARCRCVLYAFTIYGCPAVTTGSPATVTVPRSGTAFWVYAYCGCRLPVGLVRITLLPRCTHVLRGLPLVPHARLRFATVLPARTFCRAAVLRITRYGCLPRTLRLVHTLRFPVAVYGCRWLRSPGLLRSLPFIPRLVTRYGLHCCRTVGLRLRLPHTRSHTRCYALVCCTRVPLRVPLPVTVTAHAVGLLRYAVVAFTVAYTPHTLRSLVACVTAAFTCGLDFTPAVRTHLVYVTRVVTAHRCGWLYITVGPGSFTCGYHTVYHRAATARLHFTLTRSRFSCRLHTFFPPTVRLVHTTAVAQHRLRGSRVAVLPAVGHARLPRFRTFCGSALQVRHLPPPVTCHTVLRYAAPYWLHCTLRCRCAAPLPYARSATTALPCVGSVTHCLLRLHTAHRVALHTAFAVTVYLPPAFCAFGCCGCLPGYAYVCVTLPAGSVRSRSVLRSVRLRFPGLRYLHRSGCGYSPDTRLLRLLHTFSARTALRVLPFACYTGLRLRSFSPVTAAVRSVWLPAVHLHQYHRTPHCAGLVTPAAYTHTRARIYYTAHVPYALRTTPLHCACRRAGSPLLLHAAHAPPAAVVAVWVYRTVRRCGCHTLHRAHARFGSLPRFCCGLPPLPHARGSLPAVTIPPPTHRRTTVYYGCSSVPVGSRLRAVAPRTPRFTQLDYVFALPPVTHARLHGPHRCCGYYGYYTWYTACTVTLVAVCRSVLHRCSSTTRLLRSALYRSRLVGLLLRLRRLHLLHWFCRAVAARGYAAGLHGLYVLRFLPRLRTRGWFYALRLLGLPVAARTFTVTVSSHTCSSAHTRYYTFTGLRLPFTLRSHAVTAACHCYARSSGCYGCLPLRLWILLHRSLHFAVCHTQRTCRCLPFCLPLPVTYGLRTTPATHTVHHPIAVYVCVLRLHVYVCRLRLVTRLRCSDL